MPREVVFVPPPNVDVHVREDLHRDHGGRTLPSGVFHFHFQFHYHSTTSVCVTVSVSLSCATRVRAVRSASSPASAVSALLCRFGLWAQKKNQNETEKKRRAKE